MGTAQQDPDGESAPRPQPGDPLARRVDVGYAVTKALTGLTEAYLLLSPLGPERGTSTALVTFMITRAALHLADSAHTIWHITRR